MPPPPGKQENAGVRKRAARIGAPNVANPRTTVCFVMNFEQWRASVDRLCVEHLACSWLDLAGDREPLETAFHCGDSPEAFVVRLHEKYDLIWLKPLVPDPQA